VVETAVLLAAGKGTRFFPLSAYFPKEMLPLGRKPILEWLVREVLSAGIRGIVLVSSPAKVAMEHYFRALAEIYGFQARVVRQKVPRGTADALLKARRYLKSPFLVYYVDEIWTGEPSRAQQVCAAFAGTGQTPIIPVLRTSDSTLLSRMGVVAVDRQIYSGLYPVRRIVEKPLPGEAPSDLAVVSGIALAPWVLGELERNVAMGFGSEVPLTHILDRICHGHPAYALELEGEWVDAGTLERYPEAFVRAALAEGGEEFRRFLESVI